MHRNSWNLLSVASSSSVDWSRWFWDSHCRANATWNHPTHSATGCVFLRKFKLVSAESPTTLSSNWRSNILKILKQIYIGNFKRQSCKNFIPYVYFKADICVSNQTFRLSSRCLFPNAINIALEWPGVLESLLFVVFTARRTSALITFLKMFMWTQIFPTVKK